jgi:hypothetical protein
LAAFELAAMRLGHQALRVCSRFPIHPRSVANLQPYQGDH